MDIELSDIIPDVQSDPNKRENEACSQPGTNISALTLYREISTVY